MLPILIAAGAVGMVIDYAQTQEQIEQGREATQIEQQQIQANINATRLQSEQASLAGMQKLKQTIGSQMAINAARGTRTGVGSALTIEETSIGNYYSDERTRRMNLLAKEAELRAQSQLSGLHELTSESQLGQALTKRIFSNIPGSSLTDFGSSKTSSASKFGASPVSKVGNYGLDTV